MSYDLSQEQVNGQIQLDNIDPAVFITEAEQNAGVEPTDEKIFTSKAAATRFDTLVQVQTPERTDYEIGKSWLQNDRFFTFSVWDGTGWTPVASGGSFLSQPTVIYVDAANGDELMATGLSIRCGRLACGAATEVQQPTSAVIGATQDNGSALLSSRAA